MKMKNTLKIAVLCAALAGVTVACTPNRAVRIGADAKKSEKKKDFFEEARKSAMAITASQLNTIASSGRDCDRTEALVSAANVVTGIYDIPEDAKVGVVGTGTVALVKAIESESNIDCKMDMMAQVADHLMKTKVNPKHAKAIKDEDRDFAEVDAFLAKIQPTFDSVLARIQLRDRAADQANAEQVIFEKTDLKIEQAEALLEKVDGRIVELSAHAGFETELEALQGVRDNATGILADVSEDGRRDGTLASANLRVVESLVADLEIKVKWPHMFRRAATGATYDASETVPIEASVDEAAPVAADAAPPVEFQRVASTGDVAGAIAQEKKAAQSPAQAVPREASSPDLHKAASGMTHGENQ